MKEIKTIVDTNPHAADMLVTYLVRKGYGKLIAVPHYEIYLTIGNTTRFRTSVRLFV